MGDESVVDVFGQYRTGVEYEVEVPWMYADPAVGDPVIRVGISAVGGGTVGEAYAWNRWMWGVWVDGELVASAADLFSNATAATHAAMAATLCSFLAHDGEVLYMGYEPEAGNASGAYTARAREVLVAEYERLAAVGAEFDG